MKKKVLVATGGGDCPGLNAVIRGIVKTAANEGSYDVYGSLEAFNGIYADPADIVRLNKKKVKGILVKGGTIIRTTNRNNPLAFPVQDASGNWHTIDKTPELAERIKKLGFDAVINIGGDGSQKISLALAELGVPVIGVPKTIDNDLSATDTSFGFGTAVQIATDCLDRLVTTAESHHRVIIMEVMGRDAGWIALHTAIAGGAEICIIPEIPYNVQTLVKVINKRYTKNRGFVNIVIAEGAKAKDGSVYGKMDQTTGDNNIKLGGVSNVLRTQLEEAGCIGQVRTTVLGHIQRGGTPNAFDRILASAMGVKAMDMVLEGDFGKMVAFQNNEFTSVTFDEAVKEYNYVRRDHFLIIAAKKLGISFGD